MKTTKDIAELLSQEIERIAKGEIRKDVITGLEKCSGAMIKLARLEMDFAWKNWETQQPNVPWLSTQPRSSETETEEPEEPEPQAPIEGNSLELAEKITAVENQLAEKQSPTMRRILTDKLKKLTVAHARAVATEE